jgi:Fic family protein
MSDNKENRNEYKSDTSYTESIYLNNIKFLEKMRVPEVLTGLRKVDQDYLHWDELQYKSWLPLEHFNNKEDFWKTVIIDRHFTTHVTPIKDKSGRYYRINLSRYQEFLHHIDLEMGGNYMDIADFTDVDKQQFVIRNTIEEAITSSQIEGANTSRAVAKKMLLEGREPQNHGEIMIKNNHLAMQKIEQECYQQELSFDMLCELHRIITQQTLEEDKQGRLRETYDAQGNRLGIRPWSDQSIVAYVAPDKEFVEAELPRLIDFANDKETGSGGFIHPLIKAIMLHFWIGLLHPFEDGNGRLARLLFYWYLLKHKYWAFKYLSLSEKIRSSSVQYAKAFIHSEGEDLDLTYFLHYNIEKLKLARKDFQEYIKNKIKKNRSNWHPIQHKYLFNDRQIKLLQHLNQDINSRTNLTAHKNLYVVKKGAAIADLKELVEAGFLTKKKVGRSTFYYPTKEVTKFFNQYTDVVQ